MFSKELAINHDWGFSVAGLKIFTEDGLRSLDVRIPKTTDIGGVVETQQILERRIRLECIGLEACVGEVYCRSENLSDDPRIKTISSACLRCFNQSCPMFLGAPEDDF